MAEDMDLGSLLNKPMGDFPDLPNLPAEKHFYGQLLKMTAGRSSKKETPLFHFDIRLTAPGEDVPASVMEDLSAAGFNLADYNAGIDYYLTPNAMKILRRFSESLPFYDKSKGTVENFKLGTDGNPTEETQELIQGVEVMVKTPAANDRGAVYIQSLDSAVGVKTGT